MSANNQALLTDVNGHYIPQYYDNSVQNYVPVVGQNGGNFSIPIGMNPKGHQTVSVGTTTGANLTVPSGSIRAFITVESSPCRFWIDGTAPTAISGHLVNDGDSIILDSASQISGFQIIGVSSAATIQVTYF